MWQSLLVCVTDDPSDASINTTNGVTVAMNSHLSLKASLQWLFENEPAFETDLDVVAFAELVNPDGVPAPATRSSGRSRPAASDSCWAQPTPAGTSWIRSSEPRWRFRSDF